MRGVKIHTFSLRSCLRADKILPVANEIVNDIGVMKIHHILEDIHRALPNDATVGPRTALTALIGVNLSL